MKDGFSAEKEGDGGEAGLGRGVGGQGRERGKCGGKRGIEMVRDIQPIAGYQIGNGKSAWG